MPSNYYRFLDPPVALDPYDFDADNSLHWQNCFRYCMVNTPRLFPDWIYRIFFGLQDEDLHGNLNSDEEWDPTPEFPKRQEQEWQAANRVMANNMIG